MLQCKNHATNYATNEEKTHTTHSRIYRNFTQKQNKNAQCFMHIAQILSIFVYWWNRREFPPSYILWQTNAIHTTKPQYIVVEISM